MSLIAVIRSPIDRNTNCVYFGTRDCSGKSEKEKEIQPFCGDLCKSKYM